MKKISIIVSILIVLTYGSLSLNANANGKNLLNPALLDLSENRLYSIEPLYIEASTYYTFTMPNKGYFNGENSDMEIFILDNTGKEIIIEHILDGDQCYEEGDRHVCVFQTESDVDYLMFEFRSAYIEAYINTYGFLNFQLELGQEPTAYEPYNGTSEPYFQGDGQLITSYTTSLLLDDIIGTHITAYDEIDGDLTEHIVIESDLYSGNETSLGHYDVLLSVTDSSYNTTEFLLTIYVIDDIAPTITGPEEILVVGGDEPSIDDLITTYFVFEDDIDGVLNNYTIITDEYTGYESILGEKSVTIEVSDQAGNETEKSFMIKVYDGTPPIIEGPSSIRLNLSEERSYSVLFSHFTLSDDYTDVEDLVYSWEDSTLPETFDITGNYQVTLRVEDTHGNISNHTVDVEIYDDIPPILTGPITLRQSYTSLKTVPEIIALLTVSDNYLDLTYQDIVIVENEYDESNTTLGYYRIVFSVSDDNTTVEHTMHVHVVDNIPPSFTFSERIIVDVGTQLSVENLFSLLSTNDFGEFTPIGVRYTDDITTRFNQTGEAVITVELYDDEGEIMLYDIVFDVVDPDQPNMIARSIGVLISFLIVATFFIVTKRR